MRWRKNSFWGLIVFLFYSFGLSLQAQEVDTLFPKKDTITKELRRDTTLIKKIKYSFWKQLLQGNVDRTFEQKVDGSFILAPSYTREGSVGIGVLGSLLYRLNRKDSSLSPSNVSLDATASLKGFYGVTLDGNNFFKDRKSIVSYTMDFFYQNLDFWGFNYKACDTNPVSNYSRTLVKIKMDYRYQFIKNMYIDIHANFLYGKINNIRHIEYLENQQKEYLFTGVGVSLQYDSRDFIPNPQKGLYVMIKETLFPQFLGNGGASFLRTTFIADYYKKIWKGGLVAIDLYGEFNHSEMPWLLKEELGGAFRMRGYYTGRYIDNNIIATQMELRQHIFWRIGAVAWVGTGTVFPNFNEWKWSHMLITYGLGFRVEFKHNINIRMDYGFGAKTSGLIFSVTEAF